MYYCRDCLAKKANKPVDDLSVDEFNQLITELAVEVSHNIGEKPQLSCQSCGGNNMSRALHMKTSYVRGYGYRDKDGVKNDMDLYQMVTGKDPYAQHRRTGDQRELVKKLRKRKEINTKPKNTYL